MTKRPSVFECIVDNVAKMQWARKTKPAERRGARDKVWAELPAEVKAPYLTTAEQQVMMQRAGRQPLIPDGAQIIIEIAIALWTNNSERVFPAGVDAKAAWGQLLPKWQAEYLSDAEVAYSTMERLRHG